MSSSFKGKDQEEVLRRNPSNKDAKEAMASNMFTSTPRNFDANNTTHSEEVGVPEEEHVEEDLMHQENPFRMPSDDQVFLLREKEQKKERIAKQKFRALPIWEKPARITSAISPEAIQNARGLSHARVVSRPRKSYQDIQAETSGTPLERRREKENMADYIAKKREMFLVQMSLSTKREEIRKLNTKARLKEEALRKSELMLEADAVRFDKFLKENDRSAHEAIKKHDEESKLKQEKVSEIKKLNQEISKVQNEISKYQGQLEDCLKYKEFLDHLTPVQEKEALERLKQERIERARAKLQKRKEKEEQARAQKQAAVIEGQPEGVQEVESAAPLPDVNIEEEEENADIDEDEEDFEPMYFKEPAQLLDIFAAMEERNLFLIQNSQETEEALEDLKKKFDETQKAMGEKTQALHANISDLNEKIQNEKHKAMHLEQRARSNMNIADQERMLRELGSKVTQVYSKCGFNPESNPDTLDKLAEIERKLESLIGALNRLPKDYVKAAEKKKEAERREYVRKQKILEKQQAYEERLAKALARANAEIPQRTGKQLMFRSPPIKRKKKVRSKDEQKKEEEEARYRKFFT